MHVESNLILNLDYSNGPILFDNDIFLGCSFFEKGEPFDGNKKNSWFGLRINSATNTIFALNGPIPRDKELARSWVILSGSLQFFTWSILGYLMFATKRYLSVVMWKKAHQIHYAAGLILTSLSIITASI